MVQGVASFGGPVVLMDACNGAAARCVSAQGLSRQDDQMGAVCLLVLAQSTRIPKVMVVAVVVASCLGGFYAGVCGDFWCEVAMCYYYC
jgi:hypothetical protein